MAENVFEAVKQSVSTREAAEFLRDKSQSNWHGLLSLSR